MRDPEGLSDNSYVYFTPNNYRGEGAVILIRCRPLAHISQPHLQMAAVKISSDKFELIMKDKRSLPQVTRMQAQGMANNRAFT